MSAREREVGTVRIKRGACCPGSWDAASLRLIVGVMKAAPGQCLTGHRKAERSE